ncbi:MAG: hypothetical protein ABW061_09540 [Polyangiaceae bacterium]
MNEPRRLLETQGTLPDELRRALHGAPTAPNAEELQSLAQSLGSVLGMALAPPVVPAALSVSTAGLAGGVAHKGLWAIGSWFLGGAAVGLGVCAVAAHGPASVHEPVLVPQASVRTAQRVSPRTPPTAARVNESEPAAGNTPLATARGVARAPHRFSEVEQTEPPTVGEPRESEISLLHRAQRAVAQSASEALALCELHARQFPNGVFVQEREVIAIDSLLRLERIGEAQARARAFNDRYPGSAHARRIQALLDAHAR